MATYWISWGTENAHSFIVVGDQEATTDLKAALVMAPNHKTRTLMQIGLE
jgi:hypothetical protein